ncbi:hypothetical protein DIPPA_35850 [Diplonema papillatum]|nr:hypothetical protein DIPPA_35850 [Diplonema papillatum]|eukprot:gene21628-33283_t
MASGDGGEGGGEAFEVEHVQKVYDAIAKDWDQTRRHPWKLCKAWMDGKAKEGDFVLEVGCGNGRNLLALPSGVLRLGCDASQNLLRLYAGESVRCCATALPYRSNLFSHVMSIAVVHHMSSPARRASALSELARVARPGGSILLYVRSNEVRELIHQGAEPVPGMPANDVLIEWRRTGDPMQRYHHLFDEDELRQLVSRLPVCVDSFEQEKDNWVVVMTKNA